MNSWFAYFRRGLSRKTPPDRLADERKYTSILGNLRTLSPFIRPHRARGLTGGVLVLAASLLSLPQPLIYRYVVDEVILGRRVELLTGAVLLFFAVCAAEKLAGLFQQFYFTRFEQGVILDIQHELIRRALRFPKSFFDDNQTGYLMSRLSSDVQGLAWFFSSAAAQIGFQLLSFIGGVFFLFCLEWRMALGVLIVVLGIALLVRFFSCRRHALSLHSREQHAQVFGRVQEALSLSPLIKSFSAENRTAAGLLGELKKTLRISLEESAVSSAAGLAASSLPGAARVFVLALGAFWVIQGHWTLGSMVAFQAYLGCVFGPAQSLASANLQLQNARAFLERVAALFHIVPEENLGQGKPVDRLGGELEFRQVSFSYGREPVLQDVSFHIRPGEHAAILGPSGVGKTTLLSLILRFYRPSRGEVYFDGRPASELEVSSLRRRIGYVSQNTLLLSGTIRENLLYGNPQAGAEEVATAARAARIHDFISRLPKGYDTPLGEKGLCLSEGQRQRLSLARALVKDPDILILDEPASALDPLTENSIFHSLPECLREKTLLIVAHRLSTVRGLDRVLLLNENRLVAAGTHSFLLETCPEYRSLAGGQEDAAPPGDRPRPRKEPRYAAAAGD